MHTIEELKGFLVLDRNNLDEELLRQPQLFYDISEHYAEALKNRDLAKQVLEQGRATLADQFRKTSLEKVTEARVVEHVEAHPSYVAQHQAHINYKFQAELLSGLREAISDRLSAIRELVALHVTGYWGTGVGVNETKLQSYKEQYQSRNTKK